MDKIEAKQAMKELSMMLMYLSRFTENDRFSDGKDFYAWKGYDFDVLSELTDEDFIRQGSHPSRSKSVNITETGEQLARELMEKYGVEDWKSNGK